MSAEATKVEEPVAAPDAPVDAPAAETAAPETAAEPAAEAPAATEPATEAAPAVTEPVKEPAKPVEEGTLGYKGPGLLKSFIFQKKFFWFGTEPVESKALQSYLRGEKLQEVANKNVAWSSSTGEGLLYFSKKASEKASPAGIFNLSEVSDLVEEGTIAFSFSSHGHKHTFEASTVAERDNWFAVLKAKIEAAKELATTVPETEGYKTALSELTKPAFVAPIAVPKKSVDKVEPKEDKKEEKKEEKAEAKVEKKEEKKEEKTARKSRSASRKRNSIFGTFSLGGKKEEKTEVAKEEAPVAPAAEAPATEEAAAPAAEPVVAPEAPAAPAAEAASPTEARPAAAKRNSIFESLKNQFSSHKVEKKPEAEAAPAVPAKDAEPVSETAPVIPAVEASEPLATSVASPATVPTETTETPVTNGDSKPAETPAVKSDKRKSSLPWLTKKEKPTTTSDEEADKPKSPFAKLRATVKGKKTEKPAEPAAADETAAPVEPTPAAEEPVVSEPTPVVQQTTPQVTASA